MILQSLHALHSRLADDPSYELSKPGFSPQKVSFRIVLRPDGQLFKPQDARVQDTNGQLDTARMELPGEAKPSGSGINPCFLWDNQTYLLGRQPADKKKGFGQDRFEAFRQRHLAVEDDILHPHFSAVCRFLEHWKPERLEEFPILEEVGTGFGVFQILGEEQCVHDLPEIKAWWEKNRPQKEARTIGQCLLTGIEGPIARLHPKIKGIPGAQAAGANIVSFNSSAFESYGNEQSYNSPISTEAALKYGVVLNSLLTGPQSSKHRMRIGDTTCVFWTEKPTPVEDVFAQFSQHGAQLAEDDSQDENIRKKIHAFLKALRMGRESYSELAENPESTRFFLLGLAPNAARLSIRFFYQSSIVDLLDNLRRHRADMEIVKEFEHQVGKRLPDSDYPPYWEFLRATTRQGDDPSPLLGGALMRAILEASPYPEALLTAVIRRVHMERYVDYIRVASIKAVLKRNHHLNISVMLDINNPNPAYRLGRLFAVLEKIQEEGHKEQTGGQISKTIRETYFSSACSSPSSVFPRLEQLSVHHRRHLTHGRKNFFDKLIGDIKWPLDPSNVSPKTHNLEQQGLFILGYYHQRKDLFTKKPIETEEPEAATNS